MVQFDFYFIGKFDSDQGLSAHQSYIHIVCHNDLQFSVCNAYAGNLINMRSLYQFGDQSKYCKLILAR